MPSGPRPGMPYLASLVVCSACGCARETPAAAPEAPASRSVSELTVPAASSSTIIPEVPPSRWSDEHALVGVVHRGGVRACRPDQADAEGQWYGIHPVVGWVPIHGTPQLLERFLAYRGQPVVARGEPTERPLGAADVPAGVEPCAVLMQMRSDWVDTPDGIRIQQGQPVLPGLHAVRVEPFTGLDVLESDAALELTLRNTLERDLEDVTITVDYEGCYGKPGSTGQSGRPARLTRGATATERFAKVIEGPPRHTGATSSDYVAHSVTIAAHAPAISFDLTATLSELGVSAHCPKD